jgi:TatD DNase family protein
LQSDGLPEIIDTHAHLCDAQFDVDREETLRRAFEARVVRVVEIADGVNEWDRALTLARSQPGRVYCAWGFHPHYAQDWKDSYTPLFLEKANSPLIVAIGEIGLDYVKSTAAPHIQQRTFRKLVELASIKGLPLILHCREAHDDLFPILEKYWRRPAGRFGGVLHCFSGGLAEAKRAADLGLALGVDGPITYPKNEALREAVKSAGLDRIVLETDSPYLPPQSLRGKRNEPANLQEVLRKLADMFEVSPEEAAKRTSKNAADLFRWA